MPRLRRICLVVPCCLGMIAAVCMADAARAQSTLPGSLASPLAPPEGDPNDPQRFQKFDPKKPAVTRPPRVFVPSAGRTGFTSTKTRPAPANARRTSPANAAAPASAPAPASPSPMPSVTAASPGLLSPDVQNAMAAGPPGRNPASLGPIETPLPKRRRPPVDIDPYAALGFYAGSIILYPAIELIGGYDTNPGRVSGGGGSSFLAVAPELRAQSDWSRHELKADLRGSYNYFADDQTPSLNRPFADGRIDGRIDVTRDTRIDLGARLQIGTDDPGSPNVSAGISRLPVFTTFGGTAGIAQQFNRLELGIRGNAERTVWQESELVGGSTFSNDDRNYNEFGGVLRGSYELTPGVKPFAEVGLDTREHDLETDRSGYRRNSKGTMAKVGSSFELSRQLTGEVSVGYLTREYDDVRLQNLNGVTFDASLLWNTSALTTAKLTAKSTVGESPLPGVSGVFYRDAGIQVDHAFRRWLIGTLKAGVGFDDYVGSPRDDTRYYAGAGLTYKLSRTVQIKGEFRQEWLQSNITGADYTASVFLLGLRLQN